MVYYDVMVDNEGHYVRMSLKEIVASGMETVRIRSMRGKYFEIRVETLVQTDREEIIRRRNAQFARERKELREDPDYDDPRTRIPRNPPNPFGDYPLPPVSFNNGRNPYRDHFRRPYGNDFARPVSRIPRKFDDTFPVDDERLTFPVDDERLTIPEPQLRNEK